MRDVVYILITLAFFAVCSGLVVACDRLIGPDEDTLLDVTDDPGAVVESDDLVAVTGGRS